MKRVICSSVEDQRIPAKFRWVLNWFDVYSSEELAEVVGDTLESVESDEIQNCTNYSDVGQHVCWLLCKEEYDYELDGAGYGTLEVVKLADTFGDYRLFQLAFNRRIDVTDKVHALCLNI